MRIYILSLFIIIFLTNCKDESKSEISEIHVSLDKINNLPEDIISNVDYIPLETNNENLIGKIDKFYVSDDRIYVLDANISKGLFVFDLQGDFLFKIQNFGKGPAEYTELNDFFLFNDKIILLAYKSVLFFDLNGNYLNSRNLKFIAENILIKNENEVFLFQNYFLDKTSFVKNHIVKTDLNFRKFDDYFTPSKQEFHDYYRFQKFDNCLLLSAPQFYSNIIFDVTNKNYYPYAIFNFTDNNIPTEYLNYSIHNYNKVDYPILRNTIFNKDFIYFLFTYKGYYYLGLHAVKSNTTYTGDKINGVTISQPVIYDIKNGSMYTFIESLYFLNPVYYNKKSNLEEHNRKLSNLIEKHELSEEGNQIIIRYTINSNYLK